jgi:outer membrane receptor protein involved in Fe transport
MKRTISNFRRKALTRLPLAAAIHFACFSPVFADTSPDADPQQAGDTSSADQSKTQSLGEITVTAQKRVENAQSVPISMDVLTTDKLTEMNVSDVSDWTKLLPMVATSSSQGAYQPGFGQISMRGVESGSNGNHSGPQPSVGIYLDEQPITTAVGAIDPHIYDIQRIEALAGPQGTLYGASSEAGTLRIITNKPDPSAFSASVSQEINSVDHGGIGYITEGYVNIPFASNIALRVVAYDKRDAGYIDNVFAERTFTGTYPDGVGPPLAGTQIPPITVNNANAVHDDYNTAQTRGGRAALKIDLNENWSITPTVMAQDAHVNGIYAFDPSIGDLEVAHRFPEDSVDRWVQSALTVQGKIGNFDLVYTGAHLNRSDHYDQDYADYSFWYDTLSGYGAYIHDNNGNLIDPSQYIHAEDKYRKTSNELRISSPKEYRLRFVAGVFDEKQSHDIFQDYLINNLGSDISVTGYPNTIWLTRQKRYDDDYAAFGEVSFDITDNLTATAGARFFHTENSLKGFFGYAAGYSSSQGEAACPAGSPPFEGAPCTEFDKKITQSDHISKGNLTYKFDDSKMIYATYSEGFRPGGINRRGTLPPYSADFLDNYELGWKSSWFDNHLRWNGALFDDKWKDFQFAIVGANGLTEIRNANQAQIKGFESELAWAATYNLTLSAGLAVYHAKLTENYCGNLDANEQPVTVCPVSDAYPTGPLAPSGAQLPITPKIKGNITARYTFDVWGQQAYVQGAAFGVGRRRTDLRTIENDILGDMPGYGSVDLSTGIKYNQWSFDAYLKNAFDNRGQLARYAECQATVCGGTTYIIPIQPRTLGIRATYDF